MIGEGERKREEGRRWDGIELSFEQEKKVGYLDLM